MLVIMLDKDKFNTLQMCGQITDAFKSDIKDDVLTIPRMFADAYYIDNDNKITKL